MAKRNKDINREEMFSKTKEITNHYENKVFLDNNAICVQADCMDFLNKLKQTHHTIYQNQIILILSIELALILENGIKISI